MSFKQAGGRQSYILAVVFALVLLLHVLLLFVLLKMDTHVEKITLAPMIMGVLIKAEKTKPPARPKPSRSLVKKQPLRIKSKPQVRKPEPKVKPLAVETKSEILSANKAKPVPATPASATMTQAFTAAPVEPLIEPRVDATRQNNPAPIYPRTSLRRREEGRVILEVLILQDGTVGDIRIKHSSGYTRLDQAALKAVRRWRYSPARQGKRILDYWYQQPIVFALRN